MTNHNTHTGRKNYTMETNQNCSSVAELFLIIMFLQLLKRFVKNIAIRSQLYPWKIDKGM